MPATRLGELPGEFPSVFIHGYRHVVARVVVAVLCCPILGCLVSRSDD